MGKGDGENASLSSPSSVLSRSSVSAAGVSQVYFNAYMKLSCLVWLNLRATKSRAVRLDAGRSLGFLLSF